MALLTHRSQPPPPDPRSATPVAATRPRRCHRDDRPTAGVAPTGINRSRQTGLTLVETLVTFVILGFLTTLILQAVGFFAARYEGVQRVHRGSTLETLQQNWFATSVRGLVPTGVHARRFHGEATYFEGTTLEPLNADPGIPVVARWTIGEEGVDYVESPAPGEEGVVWPVRAAADGLAFEYGDSLGNWYDHWPPSAERRPQSPGGRPAAPDPHFIFDPAHDWTPTLIRMVSPDPATVWLARVEPSRRPVITEDVYR